MAGAIEEHGPRTDAVAAAVRSRNSMRRSPSGGGAGGDADAAARESFVRIRFAAGEADLDAWLALGERLHRESVHARLPYAGDKVRKAYRRAAENPGRYCLLMAELGGELAGILYGEVGEHMFSRALGATVHDFYVTPGRRGTSAAIKMLHGFRRWAGERGAAVLYVSVSSGIGTGRTDRFLRRIGFRCTGGNYVAYF